MTHEKWLAQATNGAAPTTAARKADLPASTITRQLERGYLSAEVVIKIARAYKAPVVDALMQCGIITEKEADIRRALEDGKLLTEANDQDLLWELLRRVDEDGYLKHSKPVKEVEDLPESTAEVRALTLSANMEDCEYGADEYFMAALEHTNLPEFEQQVED